MDISTQHNYQRVADQMNARRAAWHEEADGEAPRRPKRKRSFIWRAIEWLIGTSISVAAANYYLVQWCW